METPKFEVESPDSHEWKHARLGRVLVDRKGMEAAAFASSLTWRTFAPISGQLRALNNASGRLWSPGLTGLTAPSLHGDALRVGKPVKRFQAGCHANLRKTRDSHFF